MGRDHSDRVWGETEAAAAARRFAAEVAPAGRLRAQLAERGRRLRWRLRATGPALARRSLDVAGALAGLALLWPVMLATAAAIRIEDGGPVFFRQRRVGYLGVPFSMWKFRSMVVDASAMRTDLEASNDSAAGVLFKMKRDPRITRVGRLIRKLSIDELPQLFNVLAGSMSIVGPRPALPREVALYTQDERTRLEVKPGITCLWQVSGRSDIGFDEQIRLDLAYIRERSLAGDVSLIVRTVPVVVTGKGAY